MSQEFLTHLGTEESNHIKLEKKQPANLNINKRSIPIGIYISECHYLGSTDIVFRWLLLESPIPQATMQLSVNYYCTVKVFT